MRLSIPTIAAVVVVVVKKNYPYKSITPTIALLRNCNQKILE
jgi:hypothetical protein